MRTIAINKQKDMYILLGTRKRRDVRVFEDLMKFPVVFLLFTKFLHWSSATSVNKIPLKFSVLNYTQLLFDFIAQIRQYLSDINLVRDI